MLIYLALLAAPEALSAAGRGSPGLPFMPVADGKKYGLCDKLRYVWGLCSPKVVDYAQALVRCYPH